METLQAFIKELKEEIKAEILEEIEIKKKRKYYSKKEIMQIYKIGHSLLDEYIKNGLPYVKNGRSFQININDFEDYHYKRK